MTRHRPAAVGVWLTEDQADLLDEIATGDHDQLGAHLRATALWWRTLRALDRQQLVTVAVVGPHRQEWPWIRAAITPTGREVLDRHRINQPGKNHS